MSIPVSGLLLKDYTGPVFNNDSNVFKKGLQPGTYGYGKIAPYWAGVYRPNQKAEHGDGPARLPTPPNWIYSPLTIIDSLPGHTSYYRLLDAYMNFVKDWNPFQSLLGRVRFQIWNNPLVPNIPFVPTPDPGSPLESYIDTDGVRKKKQSAWFNVDVFSEGNISGGAGFGGAFVPFPCSVGFKNWRYYNGAYYDFNDPTATPPAPGPNGPADEEAMVRLAFSINAYPPNKDNNPWSGITITYRMYKYKTVITYPTFENPNPPIQVGQEGSFDINFTLGSQHNPQTLRESVGRTCTYQSIGVFPTKTYQKKTVTYYTYSSEAPEDLLTPSVMLFGLQPGFNPPDPTSVYQMSRNYYMP